MAKKTPDSVCLENYRKLCELFKRVIPNPQRYTVVYGCGVDVGMMDFVVVRKTTYTYSNYAIGYDAAENEIVILPVDIDIEHYGAPYYLKKSEIIKANQNRMSKEITIRADRLPRKYIQFVVPECINDDEDNVTIPVRQDEEAKKFAEYFVQNFMEKQEENILQKIISLFIKK
ncbi:MAG: hypothetical protein LBP83_07000 [Dysgonamonadaceae bacterium]|jgi:hypothetical protein|nr:hypothetical protein [Dysgonamonadaceae bacterium]